MNPRHTLSLLEFDKLLRVIAPLSHSEASASGILDLSPLPDRSSIEKRQGEISDLIRLADSGAALGIGEFHDLSGSLAKAKPSGAVLESTELAAFLPVFEILFSIVTLMNGREGFQFIRALLSDVTGMPDLLRILKRTIDSGGSILDTASPDLAILRKEIRKTETQIQKKLQEIINSPQVTIFLQDTFITKRAGRWVIPVRMDAKGQVAGVVHDISHSGETAFVEPLAILQLSNEFENLVADEKAEVIRILKMITTHIREQTETIRREFDVLVTLDVLDSIARFARALHMEIPKVTETGVIRLIQARHPLLALSIESGSRERSVVPLDIILGDGFSVLLITGSNAGGKTVAIKTIGLLTVMALSGMPVPASGSSEIPLFSTILADIGDAQSIEQNLSTFSAHIANLAGIVATADDTALVLIDELGTGTDPDEGAALSCAILERLLQSGCRVCATTHLTAIKGYVHRSPGMKNAAMEFDRETLRPLYRLKIGEPGQSHALDIARHYGFSEEIISHARQLLGGGGGEFESLINDLQHKQREYEHLIVEATRTARDLDERTKAIEEKSASLEEEKRRVLHEAYEEAARIVSDIKRMMHERFDDLKKADREALRKGIREAEQVQKELSDKAEILKAESGIGVDPSRLSPGDAVYVRFLGYDVSVISVIANLNRVRIRAGSIELEVPVSELLPAKGKVSLAAAQPAHLTEYEAEAVESSIRLIGLRVEEALSRLEPFLNHAALAGLREVSVIHGVGKGLLSKAVREHLRGHPLVRSYRKGGEEEGGEGITVVALR